MAASKNFSDADDYASWETLYEPRVTVQFSSIGDRLTGTYAGETVVINEKTGETYDYYAFDDAAVGAVGEGMLEIGNVQIASNHSLRVGLAKVSPGTVTRLFFKSETELDPNRAPLKNITVQIKR